MARPSEDLEGQGLEAIPHEHGLGLAIGHMAGGPTPAEVVIVHARQVVVDEAVGVNHLHGYRRRDRRGICATKGGADEPNEGRPEALAATHQGVGEGLSVAIGSLGGELEGSAKVLFDPESALLQPAGEGVIQFSHG